MFNLSAFSGFLLFLLGGSHAQIAENRLCQNASQISPGDFVVGSTAGLTTDQGSTELDLLRCGDDGIFQVESAGLWYFYRADGVRDLRVSTCAPETNFENRITVFFLEDGNCVARQCIGSSVDEQVNCSYGNGTAVEFTTVPGIYAIYVHGEFIEAAGDFGLSMFDQTMPSDGATCETALEISHNQTLQGTTIGAEYHNGLNCDRCVERCPSNPGVFVRIPPVSVSMAISISLVGANDRLFDVRIYTGECDEFECKTVNTKISGNVVTASWMAEADEGFYVYVSSADDGDEDVTDRFGILMIQEESGNQGGTVGSAASTILFSIPTLLGLSSLLSINPSFW
jgi:hypothetical protein